MEPKDLKIICDNWRLLRGESLENAVILKRVTNGMKYESPELDDIISGERAILLENPASTPCNIHFEVSATSFIGSITLVTDCRKLEVFSGKQQEYTKTFHGDLVDDFDGDQIFRFDMNFNHLDTAEVCLKLIHNQTQLWLYGIEVAIKPNLRKLSASILAPSINLENVQNILAESSHKLTPNAEKCKSFLQSYMQTKPSIPPNMQMLMNMMNENFNRSLKINEVSETASQASGNNGGEVKSTIENNNNNNSSLFINVTSFVNNKIEEMERRIYERIDNMERNQNEKLDKIIEMLSRNQQTQSFNKS